MSGINRPGPGRYPLRPGRPMVFRCRRRGVWGFTCDCLEVGRHGGYGTEYPNRANWADAMQKALDHVRYGHKSQEALEIDRLERMFAAPARRPS